MKSAFALEHWKGEKTVRGQQQTGCPADERGKMKDLTQLIFV